MKEPQVLSMCGGQPMSKYVERMCVVQKVATCTISCYLANLVVAQLKGEMT
jgi:hypothetical protein